MVFNVTLKQKKKVGSDIEQKVNNKRYIYYGMFWL